MIRTKRPNMMPMADTGRRSADNPIRYAKAGVRCPVSVKGYRLSAFGKKVG
jgi:hypothetical protein